MPKPPEAVEVQARKKFSNSIIPRSSASSKYSNESLKPQVQQGRSPELEDHQLNLLALLEKPFEPPLQIEPVPDNLTVGEEPRFWLIHQESGLRVPGQFSQTEAEYILKTTEHWDWEIIDSRPRTPNCSYRLLCLLNRVCTPQKALEVAA